MMQIESMASWAIPRQHQVYVLVFEKEEVFGFVVHASTQTTGECRSLSNMTQGREGALSGTKISLDLGG